MKKRILAMTLVLIVAFSFSINTYAGPGNGGRPPDPCASPVWYLCALT